MDGSFEGHSSPMLSSRLLWLLASVCCCLIISADTQDGLSTEAQQRLDTGAEMLYSFLQAAEAVPATQIVPLPPKQIQGDPLLSGENPSGVVSAEQDQALSQEYEEESTEAHDNPREHHVEPPQSSQEGGEVQSEEYDYGTSQETSSAPTLSTITNVEKTSSVSTEDKVPLSPMGRRLPPVRAPVFLPRPPPTAPATTDSKSAEVGSASAHSAGTDEELESQVAHHHQPQELDSTDSAEGTRVPISYSVEMSTEKQMSEFNASDENSKTDKQFVIISSVQTSRSVEEGEIVPVVGSGENSGEEYSDEVQKTSEEATESTGNKTIIETIVTSKSISQGGTEEPKSTSTPTSTSQSFSTSIPQTFTMVTYVTNVQQQQPMSSPATVTTTTPVPTTIADSPTTTVVDDPSSFGSPTIITSTMTSVTMEVNVMTVQETSETTTVNGVIYDKKTGQNLTLQLLNEDPSVLLQSSPQPLNQTDKPAGIPPSGKSLKIFLPNNMTLPVMTEDPNILAKMLPPSFTPPTSPSPNNIPETNLTRTITDKSGKTFTLKLLTEDPSVLAAMTPPPRNTTADGKQVKVVYDRISGKNITIQVLTEDPNILAAMTPPPRANVTAENNTTKLVQTTSTDPPKLAHYPGVPQQFGKLPIITRHNVTRKPFLLARSSTRNPRPGPVIKKLSDIVNRSRIISTKRPLYFAKQNHEGSYQDDPDKRVPAESITTTIRTTTTLSPYFRWGKSLLISGNLKVVDGTDWMEELRDASTKQFKKLANEIEGQLDKLFRQSSSVGNKYKGVQVDSFSKGSVLVDYTLFLKDDTQGPVTDMLRTTYREGLTNSTYLGSLKVDPVYVNFRVVTPEVIYAPPAADSNPGFPYWAIAVVGSGIAAVVFLIVLFVIRNVSIRATRRKYGAPLTDDAVQERKASSIKQGHTNVAIVEGPYDLDDQVWNEKKPKSRERTGSTNSIYNNGSRKTQPSSSNHSHYNDGNPYHTTQLFRQESFGKEPRYSNRDSNRVVNDAWSEWEEFYEDRRASGKKDYDMTF